MLVLTRRIGETIVIDGDIHISIVQVKGRQVRVGISAPKERRVQRGELTMPKTAIKEITLQKLQ